MLGNDSDPDGDTITPAVARQPGSGTVDLPQRTARSPYTPNAGFFGTDSFAYRPTTARAAGNEATVTIKVNQLPPLRRHRRAGCSDPAS